MSSSPFVRKIFKSLAPTEKETNARASSQPGSHLVCPPGPAASTLARDGLLEQYRCTWGGGEGGVAMAAWAVVGGRVRVSFLSLPSSVSSRKLPWNLHSLLPWAVHSEAPNAKRPQRCFHGFVCNSSFTPRRVPGVAELGVLAAPVGTSVVPFLRLLSCRCCPAVPGMNVETTRMIGPEE